MSSKPGSSSKKKQAGTRSKKKQTGCRSKQNQKQRKQAHDQKGHAESPEIPLGNHVQQYADIATRYAEGDCVMRPVDLWGQRRRIHVRQTIIEDHALRIDEKAQDADSKFAMLRDSLFAFFRGTSLLFHRDMAGDDSRMPTVLALGDVHPGNFGVMPNADNVPIFSVNDFDDVCYAPFTWDIKRGATGFKLAAEVIGGHGKKQQAKVVRSFIQGYHQGMEFFARYGTEATEELRPDNSPTIIRELFKEAAESRDSWLWDRYLDENGRGFRANFELTPVSSRIDEFQQLINTLAADNDIGKGGRAGDLNVKDVAIRHGQGTASLGLARYYCLIEGPGKDATDDIIIEFKRARRSALHGLAPSSADFNAGDKGDRIAHGQSVHLAQGDVFYGNAEIDGMSFMSRERAPFRDDIDLDDLSKKQWRHYASACGHALAQAHARSDDAGQLDYDIEPSILQAMQPIDLFIDDMTAFAGEAVQRLKQDHDYFCEDHALGAFDMTLKHYR